MYPLTAPGGGGAFLFFMFLEGAADTVEAGGGGAMPLMSPLYPPYEMTDEAVLFTTGLRERSSSPSDPLLTLLSPALCELTIEIT